jgi:hypothetical protein
MRILNKMGAKERTGLIWLMTMPSSRFHKRRNLLTLYATIIFPRRALLRGID